MYDVDHETAVALAQQLFTSSALDAAFLAIMQQVDPSVSTDIQQAVAALGNDQILEYAAFLYESRSRADLDRDCNKNPPSAESEREWLLNDEQTCLARQIASVAADVEFRVSQKG